MGGLNGVQFSRIVNEVIRTILSLFIYLFFLLKIFKRTKRQVNPKPTNKTKLRKQKTTKATIFRAEELLRGAK